MGRFFSSDGDEDGEGMWKDVKRVVKKKIEVSKKEQSRKVEEMSQKLDVLCGVMNKVHAGVKDVPKVLEMEGQLEKERIEEVREEIKQMGNKVDTMCASVGKISEMEMERTEGGRRIEKMIEEFKRRG